MADFPHPFFEARSGNPLEFLDETFPPQKLDGWGYQMVKIS